MKFDLRNLGFVTVVTQSFSNFCIIVLMVIIFLPLSRQTNISRKCFTFLLRSKFLLNMQLEQRVRRFRTQTAVLIFYFLGNTKPKEARSFFTGDFSKSQIDICYIHFCAVEISQVSQVLTYITIRNKTRESVFILLHSIA